jgi:squalene-hopene/tetraprenyl-beta-curcumene cyclase
MWWRGAAPPDRRIHLATEPDNALLLSLPKREFDKLGCVTAKSAVYVLAITISASLRGADTPASWSERAAAAYLDGRLSWWMNWPAAARDHETFCVSCHTVAPYGIARPALREALGEQTLSPIERKLLDNITKRVRMWKEVAPFYPDETRGIPKTAESRGTESILNALILTAHDARSGKLGADAQGALDNMWAEQLKSGKDKGSWAWLQFHNAPWEGDSQYYGSTLAAIAIGTAPGNYGSTPRIQPGVDLLLEYLVRERESQTLLDRVMLVWASAKVPRLLTPAQRKGIIDEALGKQQADGGFSLSSFVGEWKRKDKTPLDPRSDGYATGVVAYALQQAGVGRQQPQMKRALDWLAQSQDKTEGRWFAYSLNKQRELTSDVGRFMSDAATAYAVLALQHPK